MRHQNLKNMLHLGFDAAIRIGGLKLVLALGQTRSDRFLVFKRLT
jgi:hypothetical protein